MTRVTRFLFAALVLGASPAAAQVGHDPASSPYRDLRWGQFLSLSVGKAYGQGGALGIGPHSGTVAWLRHDFLADRPLTVSLAGGYGKLDRTFADLDATTNRVSAPFEHNVYFFEAGFYLNLVGGKTWRNLAPYVGTGLGLSRAEKVPLDSTGYDFGTKFYLAPTAGVRVFLARRMFLRLEARALFWSLRYPESYRITDPDVLGPLQPLLFGQAIKEWSPVPMLSVGMGYAFRRPFF